MVKINDIVIGYEHLCDAEIDDIMIGCEHLCYAETELLCPIYWGV